jgi:hypothetical protein
MAKKRGGDEPATEHDQSECNHIGEEARTNAVISRTELNALQTQRQHPAQGDDSQADAQI